MFKMPSRQAQHEVRQEEKKKAYRDRHRGYRHMQHIDRLKVSLANAKFSSDRDENHPMEKAKKLGYTKFMRKEDGWYVYTNQWERLSEVIK